MALKAPYLLDFRHKKRRPWTSLDVYLGRGHLNWKIKWLIYIDLFGYKFSWDT